MANCKDCKFWVQTHANQDIFQPPIGECQNVAQLWDSWEWVLSDGPAPYCGSSRRLKEEYKDTLSFVQDSSDYKAKLYTRAEFGCVSFVAKETVKDDDLAEPQYRGKLLAAIKDAERLPDDGDFELPDMFD